MIQITNRRATGKKYWKSLDQYYQTPEFQKWLHDEFPGTAQEMIDEPSRRNVLKIMAASFGLAGLTACRRPVEHILPVARGVEDYIHGKPLFYNTAMSLGNSAIGLTIEVNEGRPTKIEGNPAHPASLGAAKAWHQASLLNLYDPDRTPNVKREQKDAKWADFESFIGGHVGTLGNGQGLRFLSESINSPSLAAVRTHTLSRFPGAKWIEYDAVRTSENQGQTIARHQFDKARVILSLDSDFLGTDSASVAPVKQFVRGRHVDQQETPINRLYVVESRFSITGAMADHRLRMRSADVHKFAASLLSAVGGGQLRVLGQAPTSDQFTAALAKDLSASRGQSLVVAGPRQPAAVHALVHQINQALGNVGATVTYVRPLGDRTRPQLEALKELAGEMANGQVNTLVMLGWNPVYTAPADLEFGANLKKVANSIYLAQDSDETAELSKWVIPEAHYLEAWGDAVAADGTATIVQPAIEPLHDGRTAAEVVALISGYKDRKAYDIVRNHWLGVVGDERAWRKALHDGIVPNSTFAAGEPVFTGSTAAPVGADGMEVVFVPGYNMYDGRFANNAWLQELPHPITKLTWDNAAMLSPATAKKMSVAQGDRISIERGGRKIEAPVFIQPGQADDSITIELGYGRTKVGRVGEGSGVNAYALRTSDVFGFGTGFNVAKIAGVYPLVQTQEHHTMTEPLTGVTRPIIREATVEHYKKEPHFADEAVETPPLRSIYGDYDYSRGQQWAMTVDLNSCIGCGACTVACQAENNIPVVGKEEVARGREMHWIRVDRYYTGDENDPQAVTQPMPCMQCETAPCENVCPVAATVHSPEGLNEMVYNRCVGTRYCSNNCPYKVRRFNFLNWHEGVQEIEKMSYNPDVTVRMRGIMEKCTYCIQRIQEKRIEFKAKGHRGWLPDGSVLTACQQTCPAEAIVFGNVNDPNSAIAKTKLSNRNYALLGELNTKPRTTFLAKIRNPNPELAAEPGTEARHG